MKGPTNSYCDIEDSKRNVICECKNNNLVQSHFHIRPKTNSI